MMIEAPYLWQQTQWQQLVTAAQADRFPHALLFSGARGLGKKDFALALAAYCLCAAPKAQACGHCSACQLVQANTHPDVLQIGLSEKSKVIKAEDLRQWLGKTQLAPARQGSKVAIVDEVDKMTAQAANSFLKILEEPAGDTIFILLSHAERPLLPTIKSRCQHLLFPDPEPQVVQDWLHSKGVDTAAFATAPLQALAYAEDADLLTQHGEVLSQLTSMQHHEVFALSAKWSKEDVGLLLSWWHQWMAALVKQQLGAQTLPEMYPAVQFLAPPQVLLGFYDDLLEARRLLASSVNVRLLLDNLLLKWLALR